MRAVLVAISVLCSVVSTSAYQERRASVYDRIMDEPEFSGYRTMIKGNKNVLLGLLYNEVSVFVPSNEAVDRYDGSFQNHLLLYHMATEARTLGELRLNSTIESAFGVNPPLWIAITDDGYFVNNAKIAEKRSNYVANCKRNGSLKQVLHVIDRVLDPMVDVPFPNPSAYDFLENYQNWKLASRRPSNFLKKIRFNQRHDLYQRKGGHTFFIPIDDPKHDHRFGDVDSHVIEGHVVPNQVLFTRPAAKDFIYESATGGDYVDIVLSMLTRNGRNFVKSRTVLGSRRGEVLAEIVKGDIPVTNGVVHLISRPLAVFDKQLKPFPYLSTWYKISSDPELNVTYQIGERGRVNKILKTERGVYTYFAPKNRSWRDYLGYDRDSLSDVLGRHLVVSDARYTMSKLTKNDGTILETLSGTLRVKAVYDNGTFFLMWGEKRIPVVRPDYECSDGVVHVVDGVFAAARAPTASPKTPSFSFWRVLKDLVGTI